MQQTSRSAIEKVRELARIVLLEMGACPRERLRETTLIRRGTYCGHRYKIGDFEAVWFIEEDEIKFSDHDGRVARKIVASDAIERASRDVTRRAA